jgi:hypothetical protein
VWIKKPFDENISPIANIGNTINDRETTIPKKEIVLKKKASCRGRKNRSKKH